MKKSALLSVLAITLLTLTSCQKENGDVEAPAVFTLEASTPSEKTHMGEEDEEGYRKILWDEGDRIAVNGVLSLPLGEGEGGGTNAVFKFTEVITPPYNAVYPGESLQKNETINVPRIQKFVNGGYDPAAAIMLGKGDAEHGIAFKNAMAYIRVTPKLGEEDVKIVAIELNSYSKAISKQFYPDYENATLSGTGIKDSTYTRSEIYFDSPVALGTGVIFAIPAQEYTSSIDITVVEESGRAMTKPSKGFTANAGGIYSPSFTYKAGAIEMPAKLALYGPDGSGNWRTITTLEKSSDGIYSAEKIPLDNHYIKIYGLDGDGNFLWSKPYYVDTEEKSTESEGVIALRAIPIEWWPGDPAIQINNWGLDNGTYNVTVNLNDNTLTLEVVYPEKLYTCGPAFPCGWRAGTLEGGIEFPKVANGIYKKDAVQFVSKDGAFKFWEDFHFGGEYIYNGTSDPSAHTAGIKPRGDYDANLTLSTFGFTDINYYYDITVNLKTKVVSLVQGAAIEDASPECIYLAGDAVPGGWNYDDQHPNRSAPLQKISSWVYSGSMNLNLDQDWYGFKICTTTNWDPQYGEVYGTFNNGTLTIDYTNGSTCDQVYLQRHGYTSGTYTITIDFNTMKLTISQ